MVKYQTSFFRKAWVTLIAALAVIGVGFLAVRAASAHCDGLDGPAVQAAKGVADRRCQPSSHLGATAR